MIRLICGRSRAGKTTYAKRYKDVIHLDNYGLASKSYGRVLEKVKDSNGDIIVEGIYDTVERRKALLNAVGCDGQKICIWIDTPLDVIENRFFRRCKPKDLPHPFEPPTLSEGWDEIIIIRGDDDVECCSRPGET